MVAEIFLGFLIGVALAGGLSYIAHLEYRKAVEGKIARLSRNEVKYNFIVTVEVIDRTMKTGSYLVGYKFDIPSSVSWEKMVKVAQRVQENDYKFGYWLCNISAGNPLTRGEVDALKSVLIVNKILEPTNPGAKRTEYRATDEGLDFFNKWASLPPHSDEALIRYASETSTTHTHSDTLANANENTRLKWEE